jgi:hypothetical protein
VISHAHRCIFVHIPKTGGTSVEDLIWPGPRTTDDLWMGFIDRYHNKYQTGGLQHLLAAQIREEVGTDVFSRYYKFSIVRNPWDRAVSQFVFMDTRDDLREFLGMKKGDGLKKYAELIRKKKHVQWEPQVNFVRDANGESLLDYIGRFEAFSGSVFHALRAIGIKANSIPHRKKGQRGPYQDYYDAESREMIAAMYAADIEAFGYRFSEEDAPAIAGDRAARS